MNTHTVSEISSAFPPVLLAVTGASGSIYSLKFMDIMKDAGQDVHLVFSETGAQVARYEIGDAACKKMERIAGKVYCPGDISAPPSSGSNRWRAMVILPCTMGTLGAIANGVVRNLIHRAADCCLKERMPLVIVPRETPLNRIHLENMLRLSDAGALIFPAMPCFYSRPGDIGELAFSLAAHVAELLGIEHQRRKPWQGFPGADEIREV
ncbi:MAG TPA: UbiX family flavin prenyltransferase [Thermodesulfobacteriaceae bacterium]|nr:UbiX family flavin prenyltransferase [Thermodesulfobacteriaceae bacterium]